MTPTPEAETYLVNNNLRKVVLFVPAGGVAVVGLLRGRLVLAANELALGAEAVMPLRGLLHAAADGERLSQKKHRDGDES